ncbi:MAG: MerR family transcriptional regulator [Silvanigrellaceae bacterium]
MNEEKRFLTIQELAGIVGVSTSALRAWERRYSIFSPERTPGGHRLYTQEDLKLFWYVMHLRGQGQDLKDISITGREDLLKQAQSFFEISAPKENGNAASSLEGLPAPFEAILSALRRDDMEEAIRSLERVYALSKSAITFADNALDLMVKVGECWHRGEITVAAEHALTARLKHMLLGLFYLNNPGVDESEQPMAVCATLPHELHELGLLRVALYLKKWGYRVTYLGANTPIVDLEEYCSRKQPTLVVVSCATSLNITNMLHSFQKLSVLVSPHSPVIVGGSGVSVIAQNHPDVRNLIILQKLADLETIARVANENRKAPAAERFKILKSELEG